MSELVGKKLGPYQVLLKIRSTHTNTIYKAFHQQLGRYVTLQVVLPDQAHPESLLPKLKDYARIISRLSHPNIGTLLDCEMYDGQICLAYDFTPRNILRRRFKIKMKWDDAARSLIPVSQALTYAHQQGIIHGHIRPESILINTDNSAVLFDFGLELLVVQEIIAESAGNWFGSDGSCYAPPEQTMGKQLDARADIYSLGMVLFELVTGQRAYQGERSIDEIVQQMITPLPAPRSFSPDLPKLAEALLRRSLAPDPAGRFQDMQHMSTLLARIALHQPVYPQMLRDPNWKPRSMPKPAMLAVLGMILTVIFLVCGWLFLHDKAPLALAVDATATNTASAEISAPENPSSDISGAVTPISTSPSLLDDSAPSTNTDAGSAALDNMNASQATPVADKGIQFPLLAGTTIPYSSSVKLEPESVNQMINISQIGIGWLNDIAWDPTHNRMAVATTTGIYILNSPDYTITNHIDTSGAVLCAAFSPDGLELATGDADGLVRIWDLGTGSEKHTLSGHLLSVRRVIYSISGSRLVSVSDDPTAWLWDPINGTVIKELKLDGQIQPVNGAAFTQDEKTLVTVSSDFNIMWWDAADGASQKVVTGPTPMLDAAFSPDGKILYTTGNNRTIVAWDTSTEKDFEVLATADTAINELEISPDGKLLAAAESGGKVTVFTSGGENLWTSTNTSLPRSTMLGKTYTNRIAFTPDSQTLVSGIWDNTIRFWQAMTGQDTGTVYHFSDFIKSLAVSPKNTYLAGVVNGGGVKIWKLSNGELVNANPFPGELVNGKMFSTDDRMIATKLDANTVAIYQISNGEELYHFTGHASIKSISFSNTGKYLAAGDASGMKIWSLSSGQELITSANYGMDGCTIVSPQGGKTLAIANRENYIGFIDDVTDDICSITHSNWMLTLSYRVDNKPYLAATGGASRLEAWNYAESPKREQKDIIAMEGLFGKQVEVVALSPTTNLIAGALDDYSIRIWRADQAEEDKIRLEGHLAPITALAFTNNGQFLISSSMDGTIRIWGINPGENEG